MHVTERIRRPEVIFGKMIGTLTRPEHLALAYIAAPDVGCAA